MSNKYEIWCRTTRQKLDKLPVTTSRMMDTHTYLATFKFNDLKCLNEFMSKREWQNPPRVIEFFMSKGINRYLFERGDIVRNADTDTFFMWLGRGGESLSTIWHHINKRFLYSYEIEDNKFFVHASDKNEAGYLLALKIKREAPILTFKVDSRKIIQER